MNDTLRKVSDAVGRSALFRIGQLWQARFGRELRGTAELVAWLCTDFGMEATDAENMPLERVEALLRQSAESELSDTDVRILRAMTPGRAMTYREIAEVIGKSGDYVRKRLIENMPLKRLGFVRHTSAGYIADRVT